MLISSFSDLLRLLERDGVPHEADPDAQSVVVPTELGALSGEMLMRWDEDGQTFQCIHPLPFAVTPARTAPVEGAVARINHALALPGFGLDHESGFTYFRLAVLRPADGAISDDEIRRLFGVVVETVRDFQDALRGVILEDGRPEDALTAATL